jgi:sodium-dependent dicarboxylate transporter 2/3/5
VAAINFLTEITSNLATTAMILPVLAPLAAAMGVHPYIFMIGATLAASCAFMLPVATPPNAVVFGSGYVSMKDMIRAGLGLNLLSILLITVWVFYLLPIFWNLA